MSNRIRGAVSAVCLAVAGVVPFAGAADTFPTTGYSSTFLADLGTNYVVRKSAGDGYLQRLDNSTGKYLPMIGGEDMLFRFEKKDGSIDYIHVFTNTTERVFHLETGYRINDATILLVGGGGSGGNGYYNFGGGGGGAGGVRLLQGVRLDSGNYAVVVGAGAAGSTRAGKSGKDTSFTGDDVFHQREGECLAKGGGGGGSDSAGLEGGSGGGASNKKEAGAGLAGQGSSGGTSTGEFGGGGGGAGAAGANATNAGGRGGNGVLLSILGFDQYFGGGGGGGTAWDQVTRGGNGGGGWSMKRDGTLGGGSAAVNGLGGGGGGGAKTSQTWGKETLRAGDGIVIVRYSGEPRPVGLFIRFL